MGERGESLRAAQLALESIRSHQQLAATSGALADSLERTFESTTAWPSGFLAPSREQIEHACEQRGEHVDPELEQVANQRLSDLLHVVRQGVARSPKYRDLSDPPLAGAVPVTSYNAKSFPLQGAAGGHLILVHLGTVRYLEAVCASISHSLPSSFADSGSCTVEEVRSELAADPDSTMRAFSEAACSLAVLGSVQAPHARVPTDPRKAAVASHLLDASQAFVLAHEYAHQLCGHSRQVGYPPPGLDMQPSEYLFAQEFEADIVGASIVTQAMEPTVSTRQSSLGALVVFAAAMGFDAVLCALMTGSLAESRSMFSRRARQMDPDQYPSPTQRCESLLEVMVSSGGGGPNSVASTWQQVLDVVGVLVGEAEGMALAMRSKGYSVSPLWARECKLFASA